MSETSSLKVRYHISSNERPRSNKRPTPPSHDIKQGPSSLPLLLLKKSGYKENLFLSLIYLQLFSLQLPELLWNQYRRIVSFPLSHFHLILSQCACRGTVCAFSVLPRNNLTALHNSLQGKLNKRPPSPP